jgi:hypothetical protein
MNKGTKLLMTCQAALAFSDTWYGLTIVFHAAARFFPFLKVASILIFYFSFQSARLLLVTAHPGSFKS